MILMPRFFLSDSLVARIHLIRWISGVFGVRTSAPVYNNELSYQLSNAHKTVLGLFIYQKVYNVMKYVMVYLFIIYKDYVI